MLELSAVNGMKLCPNRQLQYVFSLLDVVSAYKSQVKENETLQATIRSLRAAAARKSTTPNNFQSEDDCGAEGGQADEVTVASSLS